jgi:membrane protein insertase Oxa1/YidC/SpoIIIJ
MNKPKIKKLLQLLVFTLYVVLYVVWFVRAVFSINLIHVALEQDDILIRILLVISLIGMVLNSFYLNSLNNDQIKEKAKTKTKTLLAMYIVVAIMTLYSTDIVQYIKSF